jgi:hypothetical protein
MEQRARRHASAAQHKAACHQLGQRNATSGKKLAWHEDGGGWSEGSLQDFDVSRNSSHYPFEMSLW